MVSRRIDDQRPSRRDMLRWGGGAGALLVTTSLSGCGFFSTDPESSGGSGEDGDANGLESPDLAAMVEAGELPPLEERLPSNPLVVEVEGGPGQYGGTFRSPILGAGDNPAADRFMGYEFALRFDPTGTEVGPNICAEVEVSDDGTEFTFHLREGMKWSDGEPYTTEDIQFAYDVATHEELSPVVNSILLDDNDEPATLDVVDEHTFTLTYGTPQGRLYTELALFGWNLFWLPRHYLSQFHADLSDDAEQLAADEGQDDWMALFWAKNSEFENPDLPVLRAWKLSSPSAEGNRMVFDRNPYYFKTDPDGRQLPYIDQLSFDVIDEAEVMLLQATEGRVDMSSRHFNSMENRPILADSREEGDYRFVEIENTVMNDLVIALNLAHKDPDKRAVYQERDFRIGLSHAIDREELISAVWQRQGEPYQAAPGVRSEFFDEEFAKQYTEYDEDLANEHLDRVVPDRDDDGFRVLPSGDPLVVNVEVAQPTLMATWVPAMEMIAQMWERVGVRGRSDPKDRTLFYERKAWDANEHDAGVWMGDGGLKVELAEARWYMPYSGESLFATPWARWFESRGKEGEEPDMDAPKEQMALFRQLRAEPDLEAQKALFREILAIAKEQFYVIGTVHQTDTYGIVKNNLKGLPETWPESYLFRSPALTNPATWHFDEGN